MKRGRGRGRGGGSKPKLGGLNSSLSNGKCELTSCCQKTLENGCDNNYEKMSSLTLQNGCHNNDQKLQHSTLQNGFDHNYQKLQNSELQTCGQDSESRRVLEESSSTMHEKRLVTDDHDDGCNGQYLESKNGKLSGSSNQFRACSSLNSHGHEDPYHGNDVANSGRYRKDVHKVYKPSRVKMMEKLKEFVQSRDEILDSGWKVISAGKSPRKTLCFESPEGLSFESMDGVLTHIVKKKEALSYMAESNGMSNVSTNGQVSSREGGMLDQISCEERQENSQQVEREEVMVSVGVKRSLEQAINAVDKKLKDTPCCLNTEESILCSSPDVTEKDNEKATENINSFNGSFYQQKLQVTFGESNLGKVSRCCFAAFNKIISSDRFSKLYSIIRSNFSGERVSDILNLQLISLRIRSGAYESSPGQFLKDFNQFWENLRETAEKILILADELMKFSRDVCLTEVDNNCNIQSKLPDEARKTVVQKDECQIAAVNEQNACQFNRQYTMPSAESDGCVCKVCHCEDNSRRLLLCDSCDGAYHMECLSPTAEVPSESWYCSSCRESGKELLEVNSHDDKRDNANDEKEKVVYHCCVCERLSQLRVASKKEQEFKHNLEKKQTKSNEDTTFQDTSEINNMPAKTVDCGQESVYVREDIPGASCKICKKGKNKDDILIQCSHKECSFRYYHMSCLNLPLETKLPSGWYCPSCLCRICKVDEKDHCILLCDDCDEGYHTYCLKPPLETIPEEEWFCHSCEQKQENMKRKANDHTGATVVSSKKSQPSSKRLKVDKQATKLRDQHLQLLRLRNVSGLRTDNGSQNIDAVNEAMLADEISAKSKAKKRKKR